MKFDAYFYRYVDYFWDIEFDSDNGTINPVFVSFDGVSIAYYQELREWLIYLKLNGAPPLGVLLQVLFALREKNAQYFGNYMEKALNISARFKENEQVNVVSVVEKNVHFFHTLNQLSSLIKNNEFKQEIFRVLFQFSHKSFSINKINQVLKESANFDENDLKINLNPRSINERVFYRDIQILALLDEAFPSPQSIIDLVNDSQLGINKVSEELEENEDLDGIDYVNSLKKNDKTFAVGALIERLWSGLQIPYRNTSENEHPIGGVADVNNKGDFDKLLLTEFSNDDIVFMNKAANNELLFLEKEKPPQQNNRTRVFLIDNTIKNWGSVKILNTSIALAIAIHPKNKFKSEFYFVSNSLNSIELRILDKLINSQTILNSELTSYQGLTDAMLKFKNVKNLEIFYLTSNSTLKEPNMIKFFNENKDSINYLIVSDSNGEINSYKFLNKSKKHIQCIKLDLTMLWKREINLLPVLVRNNKEENSHVLNTLLYPAIKSYHQVFYDENFYIVQNNCLFQFVNKNVNKGMKLLYNKVKSKASLFAFMSFDNTSKSLVSFDFYNNKLMIENLELGIFEIVPFEIRVDFKHAHAYTFKYQNKLCISDGELCYRLDNQKNLILEDFNDELKNAFTLYQTDFNRFVYEFKRNKGANYSIIRELSDISFLNDKLIINKSYTLYQSKYIYNVHKEEMKKLKGENIVGDLVVKSIQIDNNELSKELGEAVYNEIKVHTQHAHYVLHNRIKRESALVLKNKLESIGLICYFKITGFEFEDGSMVDLKDGILSFISSSSDIPVFYSPLIIDKYTCFCNTNEFCGNQYFYNPELKQEVVNFDYFEEKYIIPFFKQIES